MKKRAARVVLVLALLTLAGGAVFLAITRSSAVEQARARASAIDAAQARTEAALAELAAAQRGYIAPGQGLDFWTGKVDDAMAAAGSALTALRDLASNPAATAKVDSALSRLSDFTSMDARARDYARAEQRTMAADLIFADGYEILAAARQDAASAAITSREGTATALARDSRIHLASIAVLGLLAAISALGYLRAPQPAVTETPIVAETFQPQPARAIADEEIGAALDASLAGLGDFDGEVPLAERPAAPEAAPLVAATAVSRPEPAVDLQAAADVCVDLARLLDARDLQSVLQRTASVLGANGIVVWVVDPSGQSLTPAITHGYAPSIVSRLGALPADSDNATASAWRLLQTQVVDGALAVPMITSDGCSGVMSLELPGKKERASDVQSLARIVAAQLASVVAPAAEAQNRQAI